MNVDISSLIDSIKLSQIEACYNVQNALNDIDIKYDDIVCRANAYTDISVFNEYCVTCTNLDTLNLDDEYMNTLNEFSVLVQEAQNVSKPNIFVRIWNKIRQLFAWIGKQLTRLWNFIFKRKPKKTVDQICADVIPHINQESTYIIQESTESKNDDVLTIHLPASPDSVIKECDIHVAAKDLIIKINNGKCEIHPSNIGKDMKWKAIPHDDSGNARISNAHDGPSVLASDNVRNSAIATFVDFVNNPNTFYNFIKDIIESITYDNGIISFNKDFESKTKFIAHMLDDNGNRDVNWSFTFDQITYANKQIDDLSRRFIKVDNVPSNFNGTADQIDGFRILTKLIERLCYGSSHVCRGISQIYMCDKKYVGTIKDLETLSVFVQALIQAGIPTKYVAFNTWVVMDHSLTNGEYSSMNQKQDNFGNYTKTSTNGIQTVTPQTVPNKVHLPKWGQTRVTFYPSGVGSVIKIAMNSAGIIGNKREIQVYEMYNTIKYDDHTLAEELLVKIESHSSNYCIIQSEKLKPNGEGSKPVTDQEIGYIKQLLLDSYKQHPNLPKINDLHANNFGITLDDSEFKILDYGGR